MSAPKKHTKKAEAKARTKAKAEARAKSKAARGHVEPVPPSVAQRLIVHRLDMLTAILRQLYPKADRITVCRAPHGLRVLIISREFLALCHRDRDLDFGRRVMPLITDRIALTFLATPEEEWSGEWPFTNREHFLNPEVSWRGVA